MQRSGKIAKGTFTEYIGGSANEPSVDPNEVDDDFDDELYQKYASNTSVPSYEWFEEAEKEEVPGYKVELARSGRSKCKSCEGTIAKDSIRVGSLDKVCFIVCVVVWLCIMILNMIYDILILYSSHHILYVLLAFKHRWLEVMEGGTSWNVGECQRRFRVD